MEEKYRHFLFGIVASVGLCFITLVFFTGDEALKNDPAFLYFFLFLLFIILFLLIVYFALEIIFVSPSTSTKWHIVTECSQDQELRSKRNLLFYQDITVFPSSIISYCEAVKQVEFAGSDCYFMPGSFEGCANLEYIKLPHRLERIPDNMFRNCSSLKEIIIPPTVKSIGKNAFKGCSGLTKVTFGESSKLESIGDSAFSECSGLTSVEILESVTSIGRGAFKGCSGLSSMKIPVGVTSIGDDAFSGCSRLSSVEIPESVTSIGRGTFKDCSGLTSVEIPAGVVDSGLFPAVTGECRVVVTDEITGTTVEKLRSMIDGMSAGAKIRLDLSQTTGLTSIGSEVFKGCDSLTSVTFGEGSQLTDIGNSAFWGCKGLTSVEIPASVTSIGRGTFKDCSGLTRVTFGKGSKLESIGRGAFKGCSGLTRVTFGKGSKLESIGRGAFKGCSGLTRVTFGDTSEWYVTKSETGAAKEADYEIVELNSKKPTRNAKKLVKKCADRYWYKKK